MRLYRACVGRAALGTRSAALVLSDARNVETVVDGGTARQEHVRLRRSAIVGERSQFRIDILPVVRLRERGAVCVVRDIAAQGDKARAVAVRLVIVIAPIVGKQNIFHLDAANDAPVAVRARAKVGFVIGNRHELKIAAAAMLEITAPAVPHGASLIAAQGRIPQHRVCKAVNTASIARCNVAAKGASQNGRRIPKIRHPRAETCVIPADGRRLHRQRSTMRNPTAAIARSVVLDDGCSDGRVAKIINRPAAVARLIRVERRFFDCVGRAKIGVQRAAFCRSIIGKGRILEGQCAAVVGDGAAISSAGGGFVVVKRA